MKLTHLLFSFKAELPPEVLELKGVSDLNAH